MTENGFLNIIQLGREKTKRDAFLVEYELSWDLFLENTDPVKHNKISVSHLDITITI
jgi:hypothetical protein